MIFDESYFEGGAPGGYDAYGRTAYHMLSAASKARRLKSEFDLKGAVLIVGCAYGFLIEELVKLGIDAYGMDISPFAIGQATPEIQSRLVLGDASKVEPYIQLSERTGLVTFSHIISENMFCCLTDREADNFHIISVFFAEEVLHLVENRPALIKWYNYRPITDLRQLYKHSSVTFKIQA